MAKKGDSKRSTVPVPADRTEAAQYLADIGKAQRELDKIQAGLEAKIAALQTEAMERAASHEEAIIQKVDGLFAFAQTHRDELTDGGRTKTVEFPTGTLSWRLTPPAIRIKNTEVVLDSLRALGLERFIRVKQEPNREALLEERGCAVAVNGVSISQHEEFIVKAVAEGIEIASRTKKLKKPC